LAKANIIKIYIAITISLDKARLVAYLMFIAINNIAKTR